MHEASVGSALTSFSVTVTLAQRANGIVSVVERQHFDTMAYEAPAVSLELPLPPLVAPVRDQFQ